MCLLPDFKKHVLSDFKSYLLIEHHFGAQAMYARPHQGEQIREGHFVALGNPDQQVRDPPAKRGWKGTT